MIQLGEAKTVLAGGMENMSQSPHVVRGARWGLALGQQTKFEGQVSYIGRGPRAKPFGVGNPDALRIDTRLPGENLYMQIAFDTHLAADTVRGIARDRPAQIVPIQEIERNDKGGHNRQNPPTRPEHPRRYGAQKSRNLPPPRIAAWVCRGSDWFGAVCHGH